MDIDYEFLEECTSNSESFFRDCLTIRDHQTSKLLPFDMNFGQTILHEIAEKQLAETGRVRIIFDKSRRFGGSTYVEARFYWKTSTQYNKNTFIVGHEEESTKTLFAMAKLFNEKNPIAPKTMASNAQELKFDTKSGDGLKSEYRLATAKNTGAGRSQGIHYLHLSEEAFWPNNAPELLLGLMQCVPDPPAESEVWRESTCNGYGNTFQLSVFEAYDSGRNVYYEKDGIPYAWKNPKSDWILVFIPWFSIEKYTMAIPECELEAFKARVSEKVYDGESEKWVDSEAMSLRKKYGVSYEKLYWREWAIENKCNGSVSKFHQEYPSDPMEGFLTTGTNVFGKLLCDEIERAIKKPVLIGELSRQTGKVIVRHRPYGSFTIWEKPVMGRTYYITCDVAGGIKQKITTDTKEPDRTCIDVWDLGTGEQVAQWHGHRDYDVVDDLIEMIGEYYSPKRAGEKQRLPVAAVELNNHGYTVVTGLEEKMYPQYKNERGGYGWLTNKRTKPMMPDKLNECSKDSSIKINSMVTISEMRTFIEENGHFYAAPGCNDDCVISACIMSSIIHLVSRSNRSTNTRSGRVGFTNLRDSGNDSDGYEPSYEEVYV